MCVCVCVCVCVCLNIDAPAISSTSILPRSARTAWFSLPVVCRAPPEQTLARGRRERPARAGRVGGEGGRRSREVRTEGESAHQHVESARKGARGEAAGRASGARAEDATTRKVAAVIEAGARAHADGSDRPSSSRVHPRPRGRCDTRRVPGKAAIWHARGRGLLGHVLLSTSSRLQSTR